MYEPSEVARYFHSKSNEICDCTRMTSGCLSASLVDLHQERDLVVERHVVGLDLDRHRPVVGVGLDRRQLDLEALADGARLGHLGGLRGDLLDLVLGDERAAGKAPHAAVDDAHAEAGALFAAAAAEAAAAGDDRSRTPTASLTLRVKRMSA